MKNESEMSDEIALTFRCEQEELIGILNVGDTSNTVGVLFIVGGRQYRVGAHRQFTMLARELASNGFPVFRFDVRGMGDSGGEPRHFLELENDISCALNLFKEKSPQVTRVLLWGLCDGASAAIVSACSLPSVAGVVMVNPWIATDSNAAKMQLKYYYRDRIFSKQFWRKIIEGKMNLLYAITSFSGTLWKSLRGFSDKPDRTLPNIILGAIEEYTGKIYIVVSEKDITAKEFEAEYHERYKNQDGQNGKIVLQRVLADHTFTSVDQQEKLCALTVGFAKSLQSVRV